MAKVSDDVLKLDVTKVPSDIDVSSAGVFKNKVYDFKFGPLAELNEFSYSLTNGDGWQSVRINIDADESFSFVKNEQEFDLSGSGEVAEDPSEYVLRFGEL